jgi:uncharacterized membrane protein YphA (DoxX/SURF4 family)
MLDAEHALARRERARLSQPRGRGLASGRITLIALPGRLAPGCATLAFRIVLSCVFLTAGLAKVARLEQFTGIVASYRLLPERLVKLVATWVPRLEFAVGALLAAGVPLAPVALLVSAFAAGVAINVLRGRAINCGCFGSPSQKSPGWWCSETGFWPRWP